MPEHSVDKHFASVLILEQSGRVSDGWCFGAWVEGEEGFGVRVFHLSTPINSIFVELNSFRFGVGITGYQQERSRISRGSLGGFRMTKSRTLMLFVVRNLIAREHGSIQQLKIQNPLRRKLTSVRNTA